MRGLVLRFFVTVRARTRLIIFLIDSREKRLYPGNLIYLEKFRRILHGETFRTIVAQLVLRVTLSRISIEPSNRYRRVSARKIQD